MLTAPSRVRVRVRVPHCRINKFFFFFITFLMLFHFEYVSCQIKSFSNFISAGIHEPSSGEKFHLEWIWEKILGKKIINEPIRWQMLLLTFLSYALSHKTVQRSVAKTAGTIFPQSKLLLSFIMRKFQNNEQENVISGHALLLLRWIDFCERWPLISKHITTFVLCIIFCQDYDDWD